MHADTVTLDRRSSPPVGFRHEDYARSMAEFGEPIELASSGGFVVARKIPGSEHRDAMGVYPFTVLRDWRALCEDVAHLPGDLVSLTMVTDPFAPDPPVADDACFELVRPFKPHYVMDLEAAPQPVLGRHHRRQVKRALDALVYEVVPEPVGLATEWWSLYRHTIDRHRLTGIQAFSSAAIEAQLSVPGAVVVRALLDDRPVAANLWFLDGSAAYGHLVGMSPDGYRFAASYGLVWTAAKWFRGRCRWLDLGGTAGAAHDETSGHASFKKGWATTLIGTYLCGAILDPEVFATLAAGSGSTGGYFPDYRAGEMVQGLL